MFPNQFLTKIQDLAKRYAVTAATCFDGGQMIGKRAYEYYEIPRRSPAQQQHRYEFTPHLRYGVAGVIMNAPYTSVA